MQTFDAIVVGMGQAGPSLAGKLTAAGMRVAVAERKLMGGTCVNAGCTPTKTLVASAHAAFVARRARDFGVSVGDVAVDMKAVKARKDAIVKKSHDGVDSWVRGMANCTVFNAAARFTAPGVMRVGDAEISAPRIFLNVGARPSIPAFASAPGLNFLTSTTILDLDVVPEHLVIVGGSYIGLEFAQIYRRFGARVTVVERGARLIAHEDPEFSAQVQAILEAEGIEFRLNSECIQMDPDGDRVRVGLACSESDKSVTGSHTLLAVGRTPNTDDLGLDLAGIHADARGYITVDDELRTSAEGVWALGDCNGRGAFTHTSYNDFEIVAANVLTAERRRVSERVPCYALYTDPPLGHAGLTEAEARKSGKNLLIGRRAMTRVSRAIEKGETWGEMKVIVDADTRKILGATILGVGGDEAIHMIQSWIYAGGTADSVTHTMAIHPTVAELLPTVFADLKPAG